MVRVTREPGTGDQSRTAADTAAAGDAATLGGDAALGMLIGVVAVQNETSAGRAKLGTGGPGVIAGHHAHGFAANNVYPSDVNTFFGQMGGTIPKILYAALGPTAISTTNPWTDPNNCRLVDTAACVTFANQCKEYIDANPSIEIANFWNELKGYANGWQQANRDLFYTHYIAWATRMREILPSFPIGGPYSTGGLYPDNLDDLLAIHEGFIDNVITPHPELVDFIVWDHGSGVQIVEGVPAHEFYTNIYSSQGVTLPHMDSEYYPGGHGTANPLSPGPHARELLAMAENPLMGWVMHWGGGSDSQMKSPLWNSSGVGTAAWTMLNTVAGFTRHGGVTSTGANTWTNSIGETLTVSGDTVTVT